jgi:hypothetical protein
MALTVIDSSLLESIQKDVQEIKSEVKKRNGSSDDEWLSMEETCILLKISKRSFFTWKAKEILPCSQIGAKIYVKRSDILNLLENRRSV